MNRKNKISNIWTSILMVAFCTLFVFTACKNEDELDTDIMKSKETTLVAYGPNPALRGQKLTFAGTNLDKITKVVLPENIEITDIEIVSDKLIKVLVPQETVEGIVRLFGPNNLELIGKDSLFFSEPIEITSMSPQPVKAGQTLTIEGNYFNLVDRLIFTDRIEILAEDCEVWERTKIVVKLPAEAAPGIVTLMNTVNEENDEIPLEYQSPDPLDVVLPSVNAVLDLTGNKPGDVITAPGKDFDLVISVEMPNGDKVDYEVVDGAIKFTLPENISDGAIVMIPASGVKVVVANIGVAMPAEIVVTPDKGLRAGDEITIKGINMELVTSIKFSGTDAVEKKDFVSQSATEIKVAMPAKAISGEMVLNTASGKTVTAEIETLKPEVVSYNPSPASAGATVTLQGKNLDLVVSVTFVDDLTVPLTPGAADKLTVEIPLNAVSGVVVLTMANGEKIECEELEINPPAFAYLPNPPGPKAEIRAGGILTVQVGNGDKLADVQINGVSVNYILDNKIEDMSSRNLFIVIPNSAKGDTELKLVSSNGSAVYTIPVIGAGIVETVIYDGFIELDWGGTSIPGTNFGEPKAGDRLRFHFSSLGGDPKLKLNYGDWSGPIIIDDPNFIAGGTDDLLSIPAGSTYYDVVLTSEMIERMMNPAWGSDILVLQGQDITIFKISIITGSEPEETVVWNEETVIDWGGNSIPGTNFGEPRVGTILRFYFSNLGGDPKLKLNYGDWSGPIIIDDPNFIAGGTDDLLSIPAGSRSYDIVLTAEMIERMMNPAWGSDILVLQGQDITISKITLVN